MAYGQKDPPAHGQKDSPAVPASFWEIFKHVGPILFERPKPLFVFLAGAALGAVLVDRISEILLVPYAPALDKLLNAQAQNPTQQAVEEFMGTVAQIGYGRWFLANFLPALVAPWLWLALCQASLNIWDGFQAGLANLRFAARHYLTGLWILFLTTIFGFFLFLFGTLSLLPLLMAQGLARPGGGAQPNAVLVVLGVVAGLFFFVRILWPHLRRFLPLQFIAYFRLSDGERGGWPKRLWRLYESLKPHPRHLNQTAAVLIASVVVIGVASVLLRAVLTAAGLPGIIGDLASKLAVCLGFMWPLTALAGFVRLVVFPDEEPGGSRGFEGAPCGPPPAKP